MTLLVIFLWVSWQICTAHSWNRDDFPASLCLTWLDSEDCRGDVEALAFNGVWLDTSIYFSVNDSILNKHTVSQWIEINQRERAAVEYDGDTQFALVYDTEKQSLVYNFSKQIYPLNPDGNAVREEYSIVQLEHGGGDCNCLEVYFTSNCTIQNASDTR